MRRIWNPILVAAVTVASCSAAPVSNSIQKAFPPPSIDPGEPWDPVSVCGKTIQRYESTVGPGEGPAYEMVVLGDSILWGQGLLEEQKTSTIVEHDNVAFSRWWKCLERPNIPERMRCINASAFHPNSNGATAYADAILRALESLQDRSGILSKGPKTGD